MDIFLELRDYFQSIADSFAVEKSGSGIFPNNVDAGTTREDILLNFLEQHIPKRCEVIKGGFIFDSTGKVSKQIDLIITNDLAIQFRKFDKPGQRGKAFSYVDGCYCAISIKTTLDKNGLIDALENLESVPQLPNLDGRINPFLGSQARARFQRDLPYKIIFAFEGSKVENILLNLEEYYNGNIENPHESPSLIIVNNKYIIRRTPPEGAVTRNGRQIPPNIFYPSPFRSTDQQEYMGAYSLVSMLTMIQSAANLGSNILLDFDSYLNQIPLE